MMVSLYLACGSAPCLAVHMAARALGADVKIVPMDFEKGDLKKPEYAKINPMQTVPGMDDDGFQLYESRAMMTYLASKYDNTDLYPKDVQKRALVDNVLLFDVTGVYPAVAELVYPQVIPCFPADIKPETEPKLRKALDRLEQVFLSKSDYMAGDKLTLADLSVCTSVGLLEWVQYDISPWKSVTSWMTQMKALPYYDECNRESVQLMTGFYKMKKEKMGKK